ncbi:MAG: MBL fold metallo-hydrolase [Methanosarcina sp.]
MKKAGKTSGKPLTYLISGLIIVLIIIVGIISITADSPNPEQPVGEGGENDLTEGQVQVEETGLEQNSSSMEDNSDKSSNKPADSDSKESNSENGETPASKNLPKKNLTVHFLDVGQGDSFLLEYDEKAMLIDAGEQGQGQKISNYLHELGISNLNYIVATHPHSDHIGGMQEVLSNFPVKHFIDSGFPHTSNTYENMLATIDEKNIPFEVAKKGEKIEFDPAVDIEILNPDTSYSEELNENSIVLKITYGKVSFLLMGDAGLKTEEKLINAGYDLDSDILKAGHHASTSGSGDTFISRVSPEVSIIEVGAGNDYGHPHKEVLQRLESASRVYRTDLDGTIVITTDGSTYTVNTEKASPEQKEQGEQITQRTETLPEGEKGIPATSITSEEKGIEPQTGLISNPNSGISTVYVSDLNLQNEWVKLSNQGSSPISLKSWKIEDEGSKHTFTFPVYTLGPEATLTLHTGKGENSATEIYWGSGSPIWNNDGDTAYLYNSNGELVSTLEG